MTKAYVLIVIKVGETEEVMNVLMALDGTAVADELMGPYDAVAVVNGRDVNAVSDLVTKKIHTIRGIVRTVTCLALEGAGSS